MPPLPLPDTQTLTTCLEVPWLGVSFALWGLFWKRTPELGSSIPIDANCPVGWCLDQEIIGIVQPQVNLDKRWWELKECLTSIKTSIPVFSLYSVR